MTDTTTIIKGRTYTIERDNREFPRLTAMLKARGFDGHTYYLTGMGRRPAIRMAYRSAKTGTFKIVD